MLDRYLGHWSADAVAPPFRQAMPLAVRDLTLATTSGRNLNTAPTIASGSSPCVR